MHINGIEVAEDAVDSIVDKLFYNIRLNEMD